MICKNIFIHTRYTKHCWDVENRGAVGETTFHVCFLMGTPTHMYCAKRILKWFPEVSLPFKCVYIRVGNEAPHERS